MDGSCLFVCAVGHCSSRAHEAHHRERQQQRPGLGFRQPAQTEKNALSKWRSQPKSRHASGASSLPPAPLARLAT